MKKPIAIVLGLIVLVFLTGAAYTAARLLNGNVGEGGGLLGGPNRVTMKKAAELPQVDPDLVGILVRRQDNSLFLGTGNVTFHRIRDSDAEQPRFEKGYDGPVIEVVVTRQAQIYFDRTEPFAGAPPGSQIQQVVAEGLLDELGQDHLIQVWGERKGDRLEADVLLIFSPPG